ncbi:MAG TPA: hypothetical protein PLB89_04825 [Flavobacteriales bacterium]|nr:hypothetical protein [Flavobacteriales bacterium]
MFNRTYSLEESTITFDGHLQRPVICNFCFNALHKQRGTRSRPQSYASLATSTYLYTVVDWAGIGTQTCRCCGSTESGERHQVELTRKP